MSLLTELASRIKTKIETFSISLSQIPNNLIEFAKLQTIGAGKLLGNATGSAGNISELDINDYKNYLIPLQTTFADCENTTSRIDIITTTIPSNKINVGDIIEIHFKLQRRQNSGASIWFYTRLFIGSIIIDGGNINMANSTSTFNVLQKIRFIVESISSNMATIGVMRPNSSNNYLQDTLGYAFNASNALGSAATAYETADIDITSENTLKIENKWDSANVNAWIRVQQAQAYIIKKKV